MLSVYTRLLIARKTLLGNLDNIINYLEINGKGKLYDELNEIDIELVELFDGKFSDFQYFSTEEEMFKKELYLFNSKAIDNEEGIKSILLSSNSGVPREFTNDYFSFIQLMKYIKFNCSKPLRAKKIYVHFSKIYDRVLEIHNKAVEEIFY